MPTSKRQKYLEKQARKKAEQLAMLRNQVERDAQIKQFIMQMHEHKFPFGDPDIQKLLKLFRKYILEGGTTNGRIYIKDINSYAIYRFYDDKRRNCEVDIKKAQPPANETVKRLRERAGVE